jgi:phosphatidylserine synthase
MKPHLTLTHLVAAVLTALLVVAMTLAAVFVLVKTTIKVAEMSNPMFRGLAVGAELLLGVVLLMGMVYLGTHMAARIFGGGPPPAGD